MDLLGEALKSDFYHFQGTGSLLRYDFGAILDQKNLMCGWSTSGVIKTHSMYQFNVFYNPYPFILLSSKLKKTKKDFFQFYFYYFSHLSSCI